MPMKCTACNRWFANMLAWNWHRPPVFVQQMRHYDNHTRVCLTPDELTAYMLRKAFYAMEATREKVCVQ